MTHDNTQSDKVGFTKGPWSVFVAGGTLAVEPRADANGTRPNIVDWTGFDSNDQPYSVNRANAHLIAAAPELFAEAEIALGWLEGIRDSGDAYVNPHVISGLRSALAKARGEA